MDKGLAWERQRTRKSLSSRLLGILVCFLFVLFLVMSFELINYYGVTLITGGELESRPLKYLLMKVL